MNRIRGVAALSGLAASAAVVTAGVPTSTLTIEDGLFEMVNFADGGADPLSVNVFFNAGSYDLNLEAGNFEVFFSAAFDVDTDEDGTVDETFVLDSMSVGAFEINEPFSTSLNGQFQVPPFPPLEVNGFPLTLGGLLIDFNLTTGNPALSGAFGAGAGLFLTVSGDNVGSVENFVTSLDTDADGSIRAAFSGQLVIALVPTPGSAVGLLAGVGLVAGRRRR